MSTVPKSAPVDPREDAQWTAADFQRVDAVCEEFERSWQSGSPVEIQSLLTRVDGATIRLLLRELLAIEIEYRARHGKPCLPQSLQDQFPDYLDIVSLACAESPPVVDNDAIPEMLERHPRYDITGRLGRGGMGTVYAGRHKVLGRDVAIKVIRRDFLTTPGARERFLQEARTAAQLQHPNVVAVYDAEATDEGQFLVMELVSGADLGKTVLELGPLPWQAACDAIQQAALGLEAGRKIGMVHRDLSPRNLMLADDGTVKLLDFGLASLTTGLDHADQLLSRGMLVGSAAYISPEQADDPSASEVRSDLYSLGCVMHFLLTGRPPFAMSSIVQLLEAHKNQLVQSISSPDIPADVVAIVDRLLAKSPDDRFQTPAELAAALEPLSGRGLMVAGEHPSHHALPVAVRRGHPLRLPGLALAVVLIVVGSVWAVREIRRDRSHRSEAAESPEFVQGLSLLDHRQERQIRLAIDRFQKVVSREPRNARAFASLAEAYNLCGDYGWEDPDIAFPRAIKAAQQALEISPDLTEARLALAFAAATYDCDLPGAERQYREVLVTSPESPSAHHWLAWSLLQQQRFDEALASIEEAQSLAPDNLIIANNVGTLLYFSRKFEAAAQKHRAALELDQDFQKAHRDLGYTLVELGQFDEALKEFDRSSGISNGDWDVVAARTYALARQGRADHVRDLIESLEKVAAIERLAFDLAHIHAAAGDIDRGFFWLKEAIARKEPGRAELAVDPRLDPLRSDPRFGPLVKSVGLSVP